MKAIARLIAPALVVLVTFAPVGVKPAQAGLLSGEGTLGELMSAYVKGTILEKRKLIKQIGNLGMGMERANLVLQAQGRTRLFCLPTQPDFTPAHYFDMVKRNLQFHPELEALPEGHAAAVLMKDLIKSYPCAG